MALTIAVGSTLGPWVATPAADRLVAVPDQAADALAQRALGQHLVSLLHGGPGHAAWQDSAAHSGQ